MLFALVRLVKTGEKGQDAAEYALLIGLIAVVIITAVALMGTNLSALFSDIVTEFAALMP